MAAKLASRRYVRYALAVPAVALALLARFALSPWLGNVPSLMLPMASVIAVAIYGGGGPGLLTATLNLVAWNLYFRPIQSGDRVNLLLFVCVSVLISRWGQSLLDARSREALQARLLDSVGEAVFAWRFERNGRIIYWNRGAERLYGYTADQAAGRVSHELLATVFSEPLEEIEAVLERRGQWTGDLTHRNAAGAPVVVWSRMHLVLGPNEERLVYETNRDLGERRRADEVTARLATIVASSNDAIVGKDLDGIITSWNAGAERLFGYTAQEAIGRPVSMLIPPDRLHEETDILNRLRRGERIDHFESVRVTGDGRTIDVSLTISPIRDRGGRLVGISKIARDISQRKQVERAEAERRDMERMARSVLDSIPSHVALLDASGTIVSVNRQWRQFAEANGATGRVNEGTNYLEVCEATTGADRKTAMAFASGIWQVLSGQQPSFTLEYACDSPLERRWFIGRVSPFLGEGPRRVVVSHQDVTQSRVAQEALQESQARLTLALESADLGIWDRELPGGTIAWSPRQEALFGFSPGEFDGQPERILERVHPDDRDDFLTAITLALETGGRYRHEYRIVLADGTVRWIAGHGRLVYDGSGRAVRISGVAEDITERKQSEEALRNYATRLRHLHEVDRAILAARSPREIAETALKHVIRYIPSWTASIEIYEFGQGHVLPLAAVGILDEWNPPGTPVPLSRADEALLRSAREGRIQVVADVASGGPESPLIEALKAAGLRSYAHIPVRTEGELIGTIFLGSDCPSAYDPNNLEVADEVADELAVAIHQAMLFDEVSESKDRVAELARRLLRAGEDERRRISRELHDEVGQCLLAAKLVLDRTSRRLSSEPSLAEATGLIEQAIDQIRNLSRLLRPQALDALGLADALRGLVEDTAGRAGLAVDLRLDPEIPPIDSDVETASYRIVQEAMSNAIKHAQATRITVALYHLESELTVEVADDGIGFDVPAAMTRAIHGTSLGMISLRERAELAGGHADVSSIPGRGTRVRATFPVAAPPAGRAK